MSIPKDIRYDLARAEGYLQKNDLPMALESVAMALRHISSQHVRSVSAVEKAINGLLSRMIAQPALRPLLDPHDSGTIHHIQYQYTKEGALSTVLREFAKILRDQSQMQEERHVKRERLQELLHKGLSLIEKGQRGTGASFLQRAAKEYPQDSSNINSIGQALMHYEQYAVAAKVYADALPHHPKQKEFYTKAIKAHMLCENYGGAIYVFHRALQQFGRHPRSVAKLAELYLLWDKEEEAELLALEVLETVPEDPLAEKILLEIEGRKDAREAAALELERLHAERERAEQERQKAEEQARERLQKMRDDEKLRAIAAATGPRHMPEEHDEDAPLMPPVLPLEEAVQSLAQDFLMSFQDIERKKR